MEKSRNNSRRLMAIIAVVLMVCLILAMGAVTFAKYITSGTTGDQTATAAKWGFVVTVKDADKLLGKNYTAGSGSSVATVVTSNGVAVRTNGTANVVAPGTSGHITFEVSGSAEVAAKLTLSVSPINGKTEIEEIHVGDYNPVKWTLKKGEDVVEVDGSELKNMTLAEIKTKLNSKALGTVGVGEILNAATYTLSWEWALETDDANNLKDTVIGYAAQAKAYDDIKDLHVGIKRIGDEITKEAYDAISSQMSFNIAFSIEQAQ